MHISRGYINREQQAKRIHQNMALAAFHMFVGIKAADPGRFLDGLDALRIHDRRARLGISPNSFAFDFPQGCHQTKPGAFETQTPEMVEDGLEGGES